MRSSRYVSLQKVNLNIWMVPREYKTPVWARGSANLPPLQWLPGALKKMEINNGLFYFLFQRGHLLFEIKVILWHENNRKVFLIFLSTKINPQFRCQILWLQIYLIRWGRDQKRLFWCRVQPLIWARRMSFLPPCGCLLPWHHIPRRLHSNPPPYKEGKSFTYHQ